MPASSCITHESPGQKSADWDFELASSQGFGEAHAKLLAEKMGGKGEYAVFVGSLTVPLHNAWADAAIEYLKKNYPDMKLVGERYGVAENVDKSRNDGARPDLGQSGPQGLPRLRQPGSDRRRPRRRRAPQGRRDLRARAVLAGSGPEADQERRDLRRLHVESEAGRRGVRDAGRQAREGRGNQGRRRRSKGLGAIKPDFENRNIIVDQLVPINKDTVDGLAEMGL